MSFPHRWVQRSDESGRGNHKCGVPLGWFSEGVLQSLPCGASQSFLRSDCDLSPTSENEEDATKC